MSGKEKDGKKGRSGLYCKDPVSIFSHKCHVIRSLTELNFPEKEIIPIYSEVRNLTVNIRWTNNTNIMENNITTKQIFSSPPEGTK